MGSGKSTIGPILANTLGYSFADVDKVIEERAGKTVKEIFRSEGEKYFRDLERSIIEEMSHRDHCVVSLGGGSIVNPDNFKVVTSSGIMVYLKSSPEALLKRLQHKGDRPILSDSEGGRLDQSKLHARVMQLYALREPVYSKAQIVVTTDEKKVGLTVDEIVRKLSQLSR